MISSRTPWLRDAQNLKSADQRILGRLEPHVQLISVERATLRTEDDVRGWTERQRQRLIEAVRVGPVLIQ
jgi:hypothetical protein